MKVAIDLDNTINASEQSIEFFSIITHLLVDKHEVCIITNKAPGSEKEVEKMLRDYGIVYTEIIITRDKIKYINEKGISVLFDNEDRYFLKLGPEVTVFKIREEYNFDFQEHKWLGSMETTKIVEAL